MRLVSLVQLSQVRELISYGLSGNCSFIEHLQFMKLERWDGVVMYRTNKKPKWKKTDKEFQMAISLLIKSLGKGPRDQT